MTKEFDFLEASYDVLNGAKALRKLAQELVGHGDGDPLYAEDRDSMIFILSVMADRADACAAHWIDGYEAPSAGDEEAA